MNSIGQTVFKLEYGNKNVGKQTDRETENKMDKRTDGISPIPKGS